MRVWTLTACLALTVTMGCQAPPAVPTASLAIAGELSLAEDVPPLFGLLDADAGCAIKPYALFAKSACADLSITGGGNRIEGDAHSNRQIRIAGNTHQVTGVASTASGVSLSGHDNAVGSEAIVQPVGYPYRVPLNTLVPTFSFGGDVNLNRRPEVWDAPGRLKPGVYVATGRIELSGKGITGTVTLVGSSVHLRGNDLALQAHTSGVLAYATGQGIALDIAGEGGSYEGFLVAPSGRFQLTGARNTLQGMTMAYSIKVAGNSNTIRFRDDAGACEALPDASPPVGGEVGGVVSTFAGHHVPGQCGCAIAHADGQGAEAGFRWPEGIAVDARGNLLVGDWGTNTLRKVTPGAMVTTLAGTDTSETTIVDGAGPTVRFAHIGKVTVAPDGMIYAIDADKIRRIHPLTGEVTTIAGGPPPGFNTGGAYKDGPAMEARFSVSAGLDADSAGDLYLADPNNNLIRKLDMKTGLVSTLAGTTRDDGWGVYGVAGRLNGPARQARFNSPHDVAVAPNGDVFVVEAGNHAIRRITPDGVVSTLAGDPDALVCVGNVCDPPKGLVDGVGKAARFNAPEGLTVDDSGNLYVADTGNNAIRKVTPDGRVTTIAGGADGQDDGLAHRATFSRPTDVAIDNHHVLYVMDRSNSLIRRIQ